MSDLRIPTALINHKKVGELSLPAKVLFALAFANADDNGCYLVSQSKTSEVIGVYVKTFKKALNELIQGNFVKDVSPANISNGHYLLKIESPLHWGRTDDIEELKKQEQELIEEAKKLVDPREMARIRKKRIDQISDEVNSKASKNPDSDLDYWQDDRLLNVKKEIIRKSYIEGLIDICSSNTKEVAEKLIDGEFVPEKDIKSAINELFSPVESFATTEEMKELRKRRLKKKFPNLTEVQISQYLKSMEEGKFEDLKLHLAPPKEEVKVPLTASGKPLKKRASKNTGATPSSKAKQIVYSSDMFDNVVIPNYNTYLPTKKTATGFKFYLEFPYCLLFCPSNEEEYAQAMRTIPSLADQAIVEQAISRNAIYAKNQLSKLGRVDLIRKYYTDKASLAKIFEMYRVFGDLFKAMDEEEVQWYVDNFDAFDWWRSEIGAYPDSRFEP
jgi:hypothetical protein